MECNELFTPFSFPKVFVLLLKYHRFLTVDNA